MPLAPYAIGSTVVVSAGYFLLPFAQSEVVLAIALFLLRFGGQGLLSHTAVTSVAKYSHCARGRALSLASLGHPGGETMLPPLAVLLAANAGWAMVWVVCGVMLLAATPLVSRLSGTINPRALDGAKARGSGPGEQEEARPVMRNSAFYLSLPSAWMPGFILTGVFLHQSRVMEEKGWPLTWLAASFAAFAAVQAVGMLSIGRIIDRVSARRLMPFYLLPFSSSAWHWP